MMKQGSTFPAKPNLEYLHLPRRERKRGTDWRYFFPSQTGKADMRVDRHKEEAEENCVRF
jgi:hypothetical protein